MFGDHISVARRVCTLANRLRNREMGMHIKLDEQNYTSRRVDGDAHGSGSEYSEAACVVDEYAFRAQSRFGCWHLVVLVLSAVLEHSREFDVVELTVLNRRVAEQIVDLM